MQDNGPSVPFFLIQAVAIRQEHENIASAELSLHWYIFHSYKPQGISELDTAFRMLHLTGTDNLSYLFGSNLYPQL